MTEQVRYGVYGQPTTVAGMTVAEVRDKFESLWGIPKGALAFVAMNAVPETYVIRTGDIIEFTRSMPIPSTTSDTICSKSGCFGDRVVTIRGKALCEAHANEIIENCNEHDWVLDGTEAFRNSAGVPVLRAFYFCTVCGAGVIAKPGETAEQAWRMRARESLLRTERLLTEDSDA